MILWVKSEEKVWLTRRAEFSAAHYLDSARGRADAVPAKRSPGTAATT